MRPEDNLEFEQAKDTASTIKKVISHVIVGLLFIFTYHQCAFPKVVERRARDLGLMQYSREVDGFVGKDSVVIDKWTIHYLKYNTMNPQLFR